MIYIGARRKGKGKYGSGSHERHTTVVER
ncbi:hypothetical protein A2U01_0069930, partial [Trifolium medium]|nr:hypothetical protein [Trifolium medium]